MKLRATLLLLLPRLLVSAFSPTVACGFSPTPVQCRVGQKGIASRGLATATTAMAEGGRYRACAGCAIFNRQGLFLVGERVGGKPNQWQFPQGGVDEGETPLEAAKRETYEEIGLKTPDVIIEVKTLDEPMKYDVSGGWLQQKGFRGQAMYWTLFFYPGEGLPPVNLSGLGGEKPEFQQVKWIEMQELIKIVWPQKRQIYESLESIATPFVKDYLHSLSSQGSPS